jgi:hypothetical protein
VVAVFRERKTSTARAPLSRRSRRWLWTVTVLDVTAVAWMLAAGDWFDTTSRVTSVVTLGGHHLIVLWLAVVGFAVLASAAVLTGGFAEADQLEWVLLATGCAVSVVALGGALSVVALVVGVTCLIALLGRTLR